MVDASHMFLYILLECDFSAYEASHFKMSNNDGLLESVGASVIYNSCLLEHKTPKSKVELVT